MENKNTDYSDPKFGNSYTPGAYDQPGFGTTNFAGDANNLYNKGTIIGDGESSPSTKNLPPIAGFIVSYSRSLSGDSYVLREGNNSIGFNRTNSIQLSEKHVSSEHAKINVSLDVESNSWLFQIVDLSSANGSYINGKRLDIYSGHRLNHQDKIKIGEYEFLLFIVDLKQLTLRPNEKFIGQKPAPEYQNYGGLMDSNATNVGI